MTSLNPHFYCTMILLFGMVATFNSRRYAAAQDSDGGRQQFARAYIAAVQSKNPARAKELLHPQVRACINDASREYFDYLMNQEVENPPRGDYKISFSQRPSELTGMLPPDKFSFPIQPAYQLHIDWQSGPYDLDRVVRTIAAKDGRWFLVYPCPNAEGIRMFHKRMEQGRAQEKHVRALVAAMKEPLRSELKGLLNQGHKIEAAK